MGLILKHKHQFSPAFITDDWLLDEKAALSALVSSLEKKKNIYFWDSSSLAPHNNSVTFTCYLRRLSSLKQSKKSFSKFSRLWHHHPRARLPFTIFISRAVYLWPKQFQTGQNHMVIPRSQLPSHTHTRTHTRDMVRVTTNQELYIKSVFSADHSSPL